MLKLLVNLVHLLPGFLDPAQNHFDFPNAKASSVFETVSFFEIDCHIVELSVSLVGEVTQVDDRQPHLLLCGRVIPKLDLLLEPHLHLLTGSHWVFGVLVPQNGLLGKHRSRTHRPSLCSSNGSVLVVSRGKPCPRRLVLFSTLVAQMQGKGSPLLPVGKGVAAALREDVWERTHPHGDLGLL